MPVPSDALTDEQIIARNIAAQRKALGWSQDTLAAEMRHAGLDGWSKVGVSRVESERRRLTLAEMVALTRILGDMTDGTAWAEITGPPADPCQGTAARLATLTNRLAQTQAALMQIEQMLMAAQGALVEQQDALVAALTEVDALRDAHIDVEHHAARRRRRQG